jgi:hypothetical protein
MTTKFAQGSEYTRGEIAQLVDLPAYRRSGGNWNTGYDSWNGEVFVFCNVGTAGRTGHDYPNKWFGAELVWYGKTGSHRDQPLIRRMVKAELPVHVFWRNQDASPFTYAGEAVALSVSNTVPVQVRWGFKSS